MHVYVCVCVCIYLCVWVICRNMSFEIFWIDYEFSVVVKWKYLQPYANISLIILDIFITNIACMIINITCSTKGKLFVRNNMVKEKSTDVFFTYCLCMETLKLFSCSHSYFWRNKITYIKKKRKNGFIILFYFFFLSKRSFFPRVMLS